MAMTGMIIENLAVEVAAVPIDTTGAAVAGDWFNMKDYGRVLFIITQGAWAGGTPAVTLAQATSNAGAGTKALAFTKQWKKVALTGTVFAETAVVSNTFNLDAVANTITVVEVLASEMDSNNDFQFVQLNIASPGANADLVAVVAILGDARYMGDPVNQLPDPKVA